MSDTGPASLKRVYIARRNEAVAADAFAARWAAHHRLGRSFPELVHHYPRSRYCLAVHGAGIAGVSDAYDAVGMLWLREPASLTMTVRDPAAIPTMREDELRVFSAPVFTAALAVEETVLRPGPMDAVCLLSLPRRQPDLPAAAFEAAWSDAIASFAPRAARVVRSRPVQPPSYPADGIAEFWFDSLDAARDACASPEHVEFRRLEAACTAGPSLHLLTEVCFAWQGASSL